MRRSYCSNEITLSNRTKRCGKIIRARREYKFCRSCHKEINLEARPLNRIRKVRVVKTKFESAPIAVKGKRKK